MKKGFLLLLISFLSFNIGFTQDKSDFQKEMDSLFGELEKMVTQLEPLFNGELEAKLDSLDFSQFGFDIQALEKSLEGKNLDELSMNEMMDIMRLQMEQLDKADFSKFNQLFESLGLPSPNIPNPDSSDEKKKSSKKKRKSYKL